MNIKIINPIEYHSWNDQVAELPGATIFHTSNWANVLSNSYGYRPAYVTIFEGSDVTGVIPLMDIRSALTGRRGVSLPFTDQCLPLGNTPDGFHALWDAAKSHGKKLGWKHIELRERPAAMANEPCIGTFLIHTVSLMADEKRLLGQLRSSTRRNIKKAQKAGVTTRVSDAYEDLTAFYRLNCLTRKEHGLPPQPFRFFKHLFERIIALGKGFITVAEIEGRPIAACVYLHFKKHAVYKYGASDKRYQNLRANNLVMWHAIQWYAQNGCTELNFGRTEPHHEGLLQFKRGWGTVEHSLNYYRYDLSHKRFQKKAATPKSSYSLFANLPIPVLKVLGRVLYRHVG